MYRQLLLFALLTLTITAFSQKKYESKSNIYHFSVPREFQIQPQNHVRNEFVFVNKTDTTSLVVNVNDRPYDPDNLESFKEASNADVEKNYFKVLDSPVIVARGDLATYKDRTIFFHVRHQVKSPGENDFMLTYLFYNKGKEINFIFRTKERRLERVLPSVQGIVNSVVLPD